MSDQDRCECGHIRDEHEDDKHEDDGEACTVDGCRCSCFDHDATELDDGADYPYDEMNNPYGYR